VLATRPTGQHLDGCWYSNLCPGGAAAGMRHKQGKKCNKGVIRCSKRSVDVISGDWA
jgi:hypothetical protein